MKQRQQQEIDERCPMFNQPPVQNRLKSRKSFLKCVNPLEADTTTSEARLTMWEEINNSLPPSTTMGIVASEHLPPGADESWAKLKCLNRLRTGVVRAKVTLSKWGYRHHVCLWHRATNYGTLVEMPLSTKTMYLCWPGNIQW